MMSSQVCSLILLVAELGSMALDLGLAAPNCCLRILRLLVCPHTQAGLTRYPIQAAKKIIGCAIARLI